MIFGQHLVGGPVTFNVSRQPPLSDYRKILRNVGFVLIAVGVVDIGFMVYCVITGRSYSSSLNIFAVIAGVFLLRGSLAAAKIVTWFAAFLLAGLFAALLVLFPLTQPLDLWLTEIRLNPIEHLLWWAFAAFALATLVWVYRCLRSATVMRARIEAGHSPSPPRSAFALGIAIAFGLAVVLHFALNGEEGAKAIELARAKAGPSFKYHVTSMNWSGSRVHATVTAYDEREVQLVNVEWQR